MLGELVGSPGLEVDAELAGVAWGVNALLEVFGGDRRSKENQSLGGFEVALEHAKSQRRCDARPELWTLRSMGFSTGSGQLLVGAYQRWYEYWLSTMLDLGSVRISSGLLLHTCSFQQSYTRE